MWYIEVTDAVIILIVTVLLIIGAAIAVHFIWKKHYDEKMMAKFEAMPKEAKEIKKVTVRKIKA